MVFRRWWNQCLSEDKKKGIEPISSEKVLKVLELAEGVKMFLVRVAGIQFGDISTFWYLKLYMKT